MSLEEAIEILKKFCNHYFDNDGTDRPTDRELAQACDMELKEITK